ncbi:hypothetical protein H4696_009589 [Amycolatopsis lexingtonensis]|uniref:Uncharacterized protein n=2 Tax=Amycolatopsis lexingtonensis TaxID=218822 RepID=A0ABR9IH18_9PSEU|nr:hypothetical protein [Amycolatopsis lexingtonensis]MBE1502489.1 hypothetical protein [Amycolatopsis lexingtonensis]
MALQVRTTLAALGGALVVTAGAVAFAGASAAVGPSPAPLVQAAQATCVTDGNGFCTVTHGLGKVPEAVVVSANTPGPFNAFMLNTVQGSYTATTFQVRAMFTQTAPKTFGQIWFTYAAYGAATAPPTTTVTSPPATTTPATPTSTTPPTTTTPAGG